MAEERLGEKFDVKEFHRVSLKCVGPLTVLERCVGDWIQATASPKTDSNITYDFEEDSGAGGGVIQPTLVLLGLSLLALETLL